MLVSLKFEIGPAGRNRSGDVLARIHAAFLASGLGEPSIHFSLSDSPLPGAMSSVDRVLKRHPELRVLVWTGSVLPASPPIKQISNDVGSPDPRARCRSPTLLTLAKVSRDRFRYTTPLFTFDPPVRSGDAVRGVQTVVFCCAHDETR